MHIVYVNWIDFHELHLSGLISVLSANLVIVFRTYYNFQLPLIELEIIAGRQKKIVSNTYT